MKKSSFRLGLVFGLVFLQISTAFAVEIKSGPGLGAVNLSEAKLWVQLSEPIKTKIRYWKSTEGPETAMETESQLPKRSDGYVLNFNLTELTDGTTYTYEVIAGNEGLSVPFREGYEKSGDIPFEFTTRKNWRFRESGHEIFDFQFAIGSCTYINQAGGYDRLNGKPYGAEYQIFESIYETDPDFFVWLGDNIYYREPDWTSRSAMIRRWSHDRATPEMRPLLASTPAFATWDDHDYGPNDMGREFWLKDEATEIFGMFNPNPSAGLPELPGIFTFFNWGDLNFYLMDNRTYRAHQDLSTEAFGNDHPLLGKAQVDWLVDMIVYSESQTNSSYPISFHVIVIGNQVFNPSSKSTYRRFEEEFQYLIDQLVAHEVENVIFLSGDVHFSEMSKFEYVGGGQNGVPGKAGTEGKTYTYYEITSSSLTAGPWAGDSENPYRVDIIEGEADRIGKRNFSLLSVSGPLGQREIEVRYYDSAGNLLNESMGHPGEVTEESIIRQVSPSK